MSCRVLGQQQNQRSLGTGAAQCAPKPAAVVTAGLDLAPCRHPWPSQQPPDPHLDPTGKHDAMSSLPQHFISNQD